MRDGALSLGGPHGLGLLGGTALLRHGGGDRNLALLLGDGTARGCRLALWLGHRAALGGRRHHG